MNTVITAAAPNSSPMMSSKEIAELTGKAHKHVIRDIEAMIAEIEKDGPNLGHQTKSKSYTIERDNRGYVKIINLDHSHTITLITGYDARQRKKVVDRWLELETKPATTNPAKELDIVAATARATALFRSYNFIGKLTGLDKNQAAISANQAAHKHTGVDLLGEIGAIQLPAPSQDNYLTATQIGAPLGLSARKVNQILQNDLHLQAHTPGSSGTSDWSMTEKGLAYGRMFDAARKGGKGSQQQLKWKPSVVEFLRPFAPTPVKAA